MDKGAMVLIEFTGKEEQSKRVFDTTSEKIAKENGIYSENGIYNPLAVIVGDGELLKGLEDEVLEMKEGEEKIVKLSPKNAFGERNPELVSLIAMQDFKKRKIAPFIGLVIEANGRHGRVQSISGGRVRVDFNNPLAGKNIEYQIKVAKEIKGDEEKAKTLVEKYFPFKGAKPKASLNGKELTITLPADLPKELEPLKNLVSKTITEKIKAIEKVNFEEEKKEEAEKGNNRS